MELEAENWRLSSTTLVRGVSGELGDENWRLCSTTLVRGVSGELEDENWRLCSTTLIPELSGGCFSQPLSREAQMLASPFKSCRLEQKLPLVLFW